MRSVCNLITRLTQAANASDPERAEPLWAAYRAGGPDAAAAFATLMAWYGGRIDRRVRGFVRGDVADDVFQEVLVRLHRHRHRLGTFEYALRWARKVAVSLSLRALRTERRRQARERVRAVAVTAADTPPAAELHDAVRVAVARLPAKEREAVALVFFEGLTRQAAAEAVGVHRDTLAKRIDSALGRLKKALAVAGGVAAVEALAATPAGTDPLTALITAACERAEPAGGSWSPLVWWLGGLTAAVGLATGGVVWWPRPDPPAPTDSARAESLEERNERLFRADVLPELLAELARMLPPANPPRFVGVATSGTQLTCEFASERGLIGTAKPFRLRLYYCTLQREFRVESDPLGNGKWRWVDPARPIILDPGIPGLPTVDLGHERFAFGQRAFDKLPPPDR